MINKNDIKYFKKYGFIFKRNLIPASEIEQCLMSANKIKNKKNFDTKVSKYFEKSILNKKKEILVRVENFLNKEKNLTKLVKNKKILSNLNILFNGKATLFKEKINFKLISALFIGWFGILIILNPYQSKLYEIDNFSIFIAFVGALTTSLAYIAVKKLSSREDIFIIIKYFPLISVITLLPIVCLNWITPQVNDLIWIIGIGIFTQAGQTFLTLGLKNLPASQASSINYLQVLFGSIWGIYIFGENITLNFVIGSLFVLLGTIISTSKMQKTDLQL